MQTLFIIIAYRRCIHTSTQADHKPGRSLITLLLLLNLSVWIVCSFELRKAEHLPMYAQYYGSLPWSIISHLCVPFVIFYHFHSSVCLSEIWSNAYEWDKELTDETRRAV